MYLLKPCITYTVLTSTIIQVSEDLNSGCIVVRLSVELNPFLSASTQEGYCPGTYGGIKSKTNRVPETRSKLHNIYIIEN